MVSTLPAVREMPVYRTEECMGFPLCSAAGSTLASDVHAETSCIFSMDMKAAAEQMDVLTLTEMLVNV